MGTTVSAVVVKGDHAYVAQVGDSRVYVARDDRTVWQVTEADGWTGTWTRRAGKNVFDAKWRHSNGTTAQDVITLVSWNKTTGKITLKRQMGEYSGTLNVQNRRITQGTTTWYARGQTWSASY